MKSFIACVAIVLMMFVGSQTHAAYAASHMSSPDPWNGYGMCAAFADYMYGAPDGAGNAWTWLSAAEQDGWNVSSTAPVGIPAIVVFQPYVDGASWIGHVAYWNGSQILSTWWAGSGDSVVVLTYQNSGIDPNVAEWGRNYIWRGGGGEGHPHPVQNASGSTYTVVEGDTLSTIAERYGTSWQALYAKNSSVVSDPNLIYPNEVLSL